MWGCRRETTKHDVNGFNKMLQRQKEERVRDTWADA